MKKIYILFVLLASVSASVFSQEVPVFKGGNAFCFDKESLPGYVDECFYLFNETKNDLEFTVYEYNLEKQDYELLKKILVSKRGSEKITRNIDSNFYAIEVANLDSFNFWVCDKDNDILAYAFENTEKGAARQKEIKKEYIKDIISNLTKSNDYKLIEAHIKDYVPLFTYAERMSMYEEFERSPVAPFLLNLLLGFGVGSYNIHNNKVATLQLVTGVVGSVMSVCGGIFIGDYYDRLATYDKRKAEYEKKKNAGVPDLYLHEPNEVDSTELFGGVFLATLGPLIMEAGAIPGYITPWFYVKKYNKAVHTALGLDNETASNSKNREFNEIGVSFAPLINPVSSEYGFIAQLRF